MANKSVMKALLSMKCPKCHEGKLFLYKNPFNINKIHQMPAYCECCGESFGQEPGFYYGAMYVNYGFGVIFFALSYILLELVWKVPAYVFFSFYIGILLILGPYMFRYSRVIYLYLFVRYDENAIKKHKQMN